MIRLSSECWQPLSTQTVPCSPSMEEPEKSLGQERLQPGQRRAAEAVAVDILDNDGDVAAAPQPPGHCCVDGVDSDTLTPAGISFLIPTHTI